MKFFIYSILFFNSLLFSQTIDTSYFENFKFITERHDKFPNYYDGSFRKFDSKDILIEEGNYKFMSKVPCVTCFDYEVKKVIDDYIDSIDGDPLWLAQMRNDTIYRDYITNKLIQFDYIDSLPIKIGIWKTYHSNGKVRSNGSYADKVHIHFTKNEETTSEGQSFIYRTTTIRNVDYLKTGTWEYFNENGKQIRTEEYLDGQLLYQKNEIRK